MNTEKQPDMKTSSSTPRPTKNSGKRGIRNIRSDSKLATKALEDELPHRLGEDLALKWSKKARINDRVDVSFYLKQLGVHLAGVHPPLRLRRSNQSIGYEIGILSKRNDLTFDENKWLKPPKKSKKPPSKRLYDWMGLIKAGYPAASLNPGDRLAGIWEYFFSKGFKRDHVGGKKVRMKPAARKWLNWRLSKEAHRKIYDRPDELYERPKASIFDPVLLDSALQVWLLLQGDLRPLIGFLEEYMDRNDRYDPAIEIVLGGMADRRMRDEEDDAFYKAHLNEHSQRAKKAGSRFLSDVKTRVRFKTQTNANS